MEAIISVLLVVSGDKIVIRIEKCGRCLELQLLEEHYCIYISVGTELFGLARYIPGIPDKNQLPDFLGNYLFPGSGTFHKCFYY